MSSRHVILDRLRDARREEERPAPWETRRTFESLPDRFEASLENVKGEVHRAPLLEAAWAIVDDLLDEMGAERVVANNEDPIDTVDMAARWPSRTCFIVGGDREETREACANADVGLSGVTAALAETGSLVVESGEGKSRLATLLPPVHIALVPESRLTTDLFTWTAARREGIATNVTVISGPSKTADIEFTLTLGAHGPKRLVAVLYSD